MPKRNRILILCVDRDDDLKRKTGIDGPVIGKHAVLEAANKLGLADPEDSDFNAIFQALKIANEIKGDKEIALVTGDVSGGIKADQKIATQLDSILKKWPAGQAVLVTDGLNDEQVIPIVQSKLPIISINRVVVKQSDRLESAYFKIKDFLKETLEEPRMARLIFGLPAIILLLLAIFGIEGGRVILGVIGIYLLIKGFKLEQYVIRTWNEFKTSMTKRRGAFFSYIICVLILIVTSYHAGQFISTLTFGPIELTAVFIQNSIFFYWLAGAIAWMGRAASFRNQKRAIPAIIMGLAITFVLYAAAEFILYSFNTIFIYTLTLGFICAGLTFVIETRIKK
jgi:putative membrane protein